MHEMKSLLSFGFIILVLAGWKAIIAQCFVTTKQFSCGVHRVTLF